MDRAKEILKRLSAPFESIGANGKMQPDHKWRLMTTKYGTADCIPYITANQIKQRLNEVLGIDGWSSTLIETSSDLKMLICELSIEIDGKTTTRSDVGTPSEYESMKGMASDALKRSAKGLGIGAYLEQLGTVKLKKSGKFAMTENGTILRDPESLTSYINQRHPLRAKLAEIYRALSEESKEKHSDTFKEIFNELS